MLQRLHKIRTGPPGPVLVRSPLGPCPGYATVPALCRKRGSTATARFGLGVDEGEAPLQPFRDVVEGDAVQIEVALRVADHLDAVDVELLVVGAELGVELQRIRQARAAPTLDPQAQEDTVEVLVLQELLDLLARLLRQCQRHQFLSSYSFDAAAGASASALLHFSL